LYFVHKDDDNDNGDVDDGEDKGLSSEQQQQGQFTEQQQGPYQQGQYAGQLSGHSQDFLMQQVQDIQDIQDIKDIEATAYGGVAQAENVTGKKRERENE
jgi:hypothetical protein